MTLATSSKVGRRMVGAGASLNPMARVVGRDDMKPIRQTRNEVVEVVATSRGSRAAERWSASMGHAGLAAEEPDACNVGGLEVQRPNTFVRRIVTSWPSLCDIASSNPSRYAVFCE